MNLDKIIRKPNDDVYKIRIDDEHWNWTKQLPAYYKNFYDENNKKIDTIYNEVFEQYLTNKWIKPTDTVLELGGRYGIVSYTINNRLDKDHKSKNVVMFEKDREDICDYDNITYILKKYKFIKVEDFQDDFQQVWIRAKK